MNNQILTYVSNWAKLVNGRQIRTVRSYHLNEDQRAAFIQQILGRQKVLNARKGKNEYRYQMVGGSHHYVDQDMFDKIRKTKCGLVIRT